MGVLVIYAPLVDPERYVPKILGIFRIRTFSPKMDTAIEFSNRLPCASGMN
jgi:hypothetical protein